MAQAMSAREAAEVLAGLEDLEETLGAKAGGITTMVWGLVAAGIFLTYGTADPYLEEQDLAWMFSLLWMPWVAGGIGVTAAIWRSHAVSLRRDPETGKGVGMSLLFTLLFLGIAAALFVGLDVLAGVEWSTTTIMTITNGLFALAMAAFLRRLFGARTLPMAVAGLAILVVGVLLAVTSLEHKAADLVAAFAVGASWISAGLVQFLRG